MIDTSTHEGNRLNLINCSLVRLESPDFEFCDMCQELRKLNERDIVDQKIDTVVTDRWITEAVYHHDKQTVELVERIFIQGDSRYQDWEYFDDRHKVASFIFHNAIKIEEIPSPSSIRVRHYRSVTEPQASEKEIAIAIMKSFGYQYRGQEQEVYGGVADLLMRDSRRRVTALVECCSCKVSKAINYSVTRNNELWVFTKDSSIYKIIRAKNWSKMYRFHKEYAIIEQRRLWNRYMAKKDAYMLKRSR